METPPKRNNSPNQSPNKGGRPVGSMMRMSMEARDRAKETGMLPHEILLSMSRGEPQRTPDKIDAETGEVLSWKWEPLPVADRRDAAKAAAPYFAPKISTVEVIAGVSDDDLDRIIAGAAAEAGFGLGPDRESEESESASREADLTTPTAAAGTGRQRRCAKRSD